VGELKQALEGLKVVEVGHMLAGPFCGTMLADFGADVIKVEPPETGEMIRNMGAFKDMWFAVEGRNKRNITLNLKAPRGKELLKELLKDADVLIENYRPGVFKKLGFSWEVLHELNPRLIYLCASGYGQTGPYSPRPGFDRMGLAMGGLTYVTGFPDNAPVKPGISVGDFFTALFGCIGVFTAIYNRDIVGSGKGQMIDSCLSESVLRLQESIIAEYSYDGRIRERVGNEVKLSSPASHFKTKDGQWFALSIGGVSLFEDFARLTGLTYLLEDERFNTGQKRVENGPLVNQIAADWFKEHTMDECLALMSETLPCSRIYNAADIMNDEHFKAREALVEVETEQFGKITMQSVVPKLSSTPGKVKWAGAPIAKFNAEIYGGILGLSEDELKQLEADGII